MNLTTIDYAAYQVTTRARLADVYNKYEEKYGSIRLRRVVPLNLSGKKRSTCDEVYDDADDVGDFVGMHSFASTLNIARDTSELLCCMLQTLQLLMLLNSFLT